ncbi:MAG TPA: transferase hexapeptide repeat family protein [Balneolales bacterium]|nr:transferase hexapeptide repeat family protein [Balneolales bacterium]
MSIYSFNEICPVVHESSFVHPQAAVTGNVIIGKNAYIGPGAAIRGDWGQIIIEDGCNVQENCTIHLFPGATVILEKGAHMGHGSIVHGSHIGANVMIGMNAVIMDRVKVGANSIIGALTFVPEGMEIPERKVVVGNPARIVKDVTDKMLVWKTEGTKIYQDLPHQLHDSLKQCQPLRIPDDTHKLPEHHYKTWGEEKIDRDIS